jgi:hypothetical protein
MKKNRKLCLKVPVWDKDALLPLLFSVVLETPARIIVQGKGTKKHLNSKISKIIPVCR